jgi:hypothetical protein
LHGGLASLVLREQPIPNPGLIERSCGARELDQRYFEQTRPLGKVVINHA